MLSAAEIGDRIENGVLDPVEVTEHFLQRIETCADSRAFITITAERARAEAEAARRRQQQQRRRSPLDGVPIAWKDLIDVAGTPTTCGSRAYGDRPAVERDAPVVRHLSDAGMVCLGKTNLSEFAFSGIGINPHYGTPVNPFSGDEPCIAGGSSSGSAVAVAEGSAPVAIGSDTSGSVRIPASLCGLVGHHTSPRRINRHQVALLSMSLDTVGSIARTVADAILLDQGLRGQPMIPAKPRPLSSTKAIVPENYILDDIDSQVAERFAAAVDLLAAAGLSLRRCRLTELDRFAEITSRHGTLVAAEAYYLHKADLEGPHGKLIDRQIAARLRAAGEMSAFDLLTIQHARDALRLSLHEELIDGEVLLMPTVPHTAPAISALDGDPDLFAATNLRTMRNTMLGNYFGLCGVTIPCGVDDRGLPIGLLMCAGPDSDEILLRLGLSVQDVLRAAAW